ncbi:MAG: amidase family protein, partial [Alphaproteobacteria bacterium]|nr:amidase family protein [Alphaproteobacteria bacterium]
MARASNSQANWGPGEFLTIAEAARLIALRKLSPVELTTACLGRIEKLDPTLHAFVHLTAERALADARASEERLMRGESLGRLEGIPIAHKDIFATAAIPTTAHSKQLLDWIPERDATSVRRLAQAGTVMLGKLATHEFAFGGPSFDLPFPPARNPWNPEHFTAGSSSGTGAAVAAGLVLGGTGSDTGGSIRGPAALCGIAGIKPTYGLISRAGVLPLAFTLDHAGPLAWTAEDCALLLEGMAGHDPSDPASSARRVPDFTAELDHGAKDLRIGVVRHFFEVDNPASKATRAAIETALDTFRAMGASVRDVTLSPLAEWHACGFLIMIVEAYAVHEPWLKRSFADYGELFRDRVALGGLVRAADYVQALRRRRRFCA